MTAIASVVRAVILKWTVRLTARWRITVHQRREMRLTARWGITAHQRRESTSCVQKRVCLWWLLLQPTLTITQSIISLSSHGVSKTCLPCSSPMYKRLRSLQHTLRLQLPEYKPYQTTVHPLPNWTTSFSYILSSLATLPSFCFIIFNETIHMWQDLAT